MPQQALALTGTGSLGPQHFLSPYRVSFCLWVFFRLFCLSWVSFCLFCLFFPKHRVSRYLCRWVSRYVVYWVSCYVVYFRCLGVPSRRSAAHERIVGAGEGARAGLSKQALPETANVLQICVRVVSAPQIAERVSSGRENA